MIGKQSKGGGFGGLAKYLEGKVEDGVGERVGGNMAGQNARELAKEFGMIRSLKPNVSKAVYHCSLSIGKDEKLSTENFVSLAQEYLEGMGFADSQYVLYRHHDREHPHLHIVANRINLKGEVVSDRWDYKRSEEIIRKLEVKYGLEQVLPSDKSKESALSKGQIEDFKKTGDIPIKTQLQVMLNDALNDCSSMSQLGNKLKAKGATMKVHENSKGHAFGLSFELDGVAMKGSALGRKFSFKNIMNQIHKNNERDQTNGKAIYRGKRDNPQRAGKTLAEYEHAKHTGNERSLTSHSLEPERSHNKRSGGDYQRPAATTETSKDLTGGRGFDHQAREQTQRNTGRSHVNQMGNSPHISSGGGNQWRHAVRSPILSGGMTRKKSEDEDEDELIRKGKNQDKGMSR